MSCNYCGGSGMNAHYDDCPYCKQEYEERKKKEQEEKEKKDLENRKENGKENNDQ